MQLGEKLRYLREVEGTLRGLGREMTQQEIVRAVAEGAEEVDFAVLSFADREWREAAPHQRYPDVVS